MLGVVRRPRIIAAVVDMLALSAHLPEVEIGTGEAVVVEGEAGGSIWVLVSGALDVRKGGELINTVTHPGAVIGEISTLLGTPPAASVVATEPCRLRYAADGGSLLVSDPEVMVAVAAGLAERLSVVMAYLADLKHQYGDAPGVSMVSDVLGQLAHHQGPAARPGSAREPDPMY